MSLFSPGEATISTRLLTRIIILLVAIWSAISAVVLLLAQGAGAGALGAGVTDEAGQRLVGAHLVLLVPAYLLIAWRPERYSGFLWLPFGGQVVVALTVGYSILSGDTSFGDGIIAAAVSGIFVVLLGFVWVSERRSIARAKYEADTQSRREIDDYAREP